ncbi:MAG: Fe3+/spermidine/putrescine ABC transporter ATP-binding protein [Azospirillum brasilense]|nr:MAG: Fe3+/spermidine/putrescine ABC transporter ATP-binding protein [Azospirillum brasilense]
MTTHLVRFEDVEKRYDAGAPAVRGLNLSIRRGELLTLLGPSGSGKTTTLMMLAGFEQPSQGRILLDGKDIAHTPPHRRGIGVVFQSYALFPHMTVAENIAFPLEARGVARAEREARARRALETVRLPGLGDRRPAQLSGGQQQRVALARALVFEPPIVLLDEPLGALDKSLREEMQFEIRRLHRELGVTMMYVTHDQGEALVLSDRVAVFRGGRIRQLAPPRDIYDRPADAFVAGFVGENNSLPGHVLAMEMEEARIRLDCGVVVRATAAVGVGPGSRCIVAIRPERLAVAAMRAEEMGEDAVPARLEEIVFGGDHLRLRLSIGATGGGEGEGVRAEVIAKRPATGVLPQPGGPAALAWDLSQAIAFPVE